MVLAARRLDRLDDPDDSKRECLSYMVFTSWSVVDSRAKRLRDMINGTVRVARDVTDDSAD